MIHQWIVLIYIKVNDATAWYLNLLKLSLRKTQFSSIFRIVKIVYITMTTAIRIMRHHHDCYVPRVMNEFNMFNKCCNWYLYGKSYLFHHVFIHMM